MPTESVIMSGSQNINALLSGVRWTPTIVYGFPALAAEYGNYSHLIDDDSNPATPPITVDETTGFSALSAQQAAIATRAFNDLAGIVTTTVQQANPGGGADIRLGLSSSMQPSTSTAYANFPGDSPGDRGDAWFVNTTTAAPSLGMRDYNVFYHEIGHALGLKHGHVAENGNATVMTADRNSIEFSIMTYADYIGQNIGDGQTFFEGHGPQGFMMYDIAALQYMYGADFTLNNGATTYRFDPATGETFINGAGQGIARDTAGTNTNVIFRTIWDGGGDDTYDFSAYGSNRQLTIDLNPGGWSDVDSDSSFQAADLDVLAPGTHYAQGQVFNALLFNGDLRSLIENASGGAGGDTIIGNNAANTLTGNGGNDALFGNDGPDRFEGGTGADALNGGIGVDQAQYTFAATGVTVDLLFGPLNTGEAAGDTFDSIENLRGSNFNDILRGDDGDNTLGGWFGGGADRLVGRGGNDVLAGGDGNDFLEGDDGVDSYDGGTGDDVYFIQDTLGIDLVFEAFNAGHDTVQSSVRWILGDNFEDLELFGSANANGFGNALANRMTGNSGNNYLQGFAGIDVLIGGLGNDYYELGDLNQANIFANYAYDSVAEAADAGIDTVSVTAIQNPDQVSTSGYTLGSNIENGIIQGTLAFNLTGNGHANSLTGNTAVNTLTGGEGGDTYVLTDLARANSFEIYHYDTVNETGTTGTDSIVVTAVDNPDTFASIESYTLGATIENGTIAGAIAFNLTGNGLANRLEGNAAVNVLSGGEGGDTYVLTGLAQANVFELFRYDTVNETGSTGIDTVIVTALASPDQVSTFGYKLGGAIENGTIAGTLAFNLTGNGLANTLVGNSGTNKLDGGAGDDMMAGGGGNDTYLDALGDTVSEALGAGYDTIDTTRASYLLGANVERVNFTGAGNFVGTGNGLANRFQGGAGDDRFVDVLGGADIFAGNAGTDTIDFRSSATGAAINMATLVHGGAAAGDSYSGIEKFLGSNTAADTMTGNSNGRWVFAGGGGNDSLTGGVKNDQLLGQGGNDTLIGGNDRDSLDGGSGNDTMTGGLQEDVFVFIDAGFGNDTITDYQDGLDSFKVFSAVADNISDFAIANNNTTSVTLTLGANSITVNGAAAITIAADDFMFF